jgi:hypothetical protein
MIFNIVIRLLKNENVASNCQPESGCVSLAKSVFGGGELAYLDKP